MSGDLLIGIIGAGYVGITLASVISETQRVLCYEKDETKVARYKSGDKIIYEPDLSLKIDEPITLDDGIGFSYSKGITFTELRHLAVVCDTIFVCVGTPSSSDGSVDTSAVFSVAEELNAEFKKLLEKKPSFKKTIILRSTVPPSTTKSFSEIVNEGLNKKIRVVFMPEFLREGNAVYDTKNPERVVVGVDDDKRITDIKDAMKFVLSSVKWITMSTEEAEMVKYASNFMLSAKITCANQIANICENIPRVDAVKVLDAVGLDKRIGEKFLKIGVGYGGSCFPKDVLGLIKYAESKTNVSVLNAIHSFNKMQRYKVVNMLEKALDARKLIDGGEGVSATNFVGKKIAILGVAFKEDTDDTRNTPAYEVMKYILSFNGEIVAYDPKANVKEIFSQDYINYFGSRLSIANTAKSCLVGADAVIIMTPWKEFEKLEPEDFKLLMNKPVVIDGRRIFDPETMVKEGIDYYAIGYGRDRKEIS